MKRIFVIAVLAVLLIATSGLTAATAELQQKGKSSLYTMDIAIGENGVGTLVVNTAKQTYILNAEGCDPLAQYWLYYTIDTSRVHPELKCIGSVGIYLGTGVATKDGALHMSGDYLSEVWTNDPVTIADLSTAAVTKFTAGVYAQPYPQYPGSYYLCPWEIGPGIKNVTYQMYHNGELLPLQVREPPLLKCLVISDWDPIVDVTIINTAGNTMEITWERPT